MTKRDPSLMQVPPDLASRLKDLAASQGRSPEAFLREAVRRLIDDADAANITPVSRPHTTIAALEGTPHLHNTFVPQPLSVSVYE